MSHICVIGAGYVGLSTAVCFADMGHKISLMEIDFDRLTALKDGIMPINEPGLNELWQDNIKAGRISLTNQYSEGLAGADFIFIAVGTPSATNGEPDMKWVRLAAKNIAQAASGPAIVVIKSTVPVGTAATVKNIIAHNNKEGYDLPVVSNPEFLREGAAIYDFMHPSRVVIGSSDKKAIDAIAGLYTPLNSPIITCNNRTAEMSRYVCNAFLATRISFMNEMALLCDEYHVDIVKVAEVMGMDPRFGSGYLNAGLGWGGSCLPKDLKGLIHMAKKRGFPVRLLRAVQQINQQQVHVIIRKINQFLGSLEDKTIGILGLSFKPGSDDIREARSLAVISLLEDQGCHIKAYDPDPVVMQRCARLKIDIKYCTDAYEVAKDSDALILVTEWQEFEDLDMQALAASMKQPVFLDGRNFFDPDKMIQAGFVYEGIGRCSQRAQETMIGVVQI